MKSDARAFFISDLHMYSSRSTAELQLDRLQELALQSQCIVLGGDIFDFKWSVHRSTERSIEHAIRWLEGLVDRAPHCRFVYLLGNHDAHPEFVAILDRLAFDRPMLEWQPHVKRIHNCAFLHGDILDLGFDHQMIDARRLRENQKTLPSNYRHWLYDRVVQMHLHRVIGQVARPHAWVLKKLAQYLGDNGLDAAHGITDVYFGHTHRELDGVLHQGMRFHNGGAAIRGIRFRIVPIHFESTTNHTKKDNANEFNA